MTAARAQRVGIAVLGLAAFAAVVIWFGIVGAERQDQGPAGSAATVGQSQPSAAPQEGAQAPAPAPAPQQAAQAPAPAPPVEAKPEAPRTGAGPAEEGRSKAAAAPAQPEKPNGPREGAIAPSFDTVRVEPSGESVIAGRATPGATVEMLRNGSMHARVASDPSGLFAFVPQPLPPGTSEIVLQSIAPDGTRMHSRESVTIVVAPKRDAKPLVAMTSPDRPTVVLSSPDEQAAPADKPASPAPPSTIAALPEAAAPVGGSPPSEPAATA